MSITPRVLAFSSKCFMALSSVLCVVTWGLSQVAGRRFTFLIVAILISIVVLLPTVAATPVGTLDQHQENMGTSIAFYSKPPETTSQFEGQSFTAGLTGTLTEVDVAIICYSVSGADCTAGPVTLEVRSGDPTGASLGSSSLPVSAFPKLNNANIVDFVAFTFSSPPAVVAGSVYVFLLTTSNAPDSDPHLDVGGVLSNSYLTGTDWQSFDNGVSWSSNSGTDLAFRTYVTLPLATTGPVGGFMEPVNKLTVFAPYLALFGVMAVVVVVWKKREN